MDALDPPMLPPLVTIRETIAKYKRRNNDGDIFVLVKPLTEALEAQFPNVDEVLYNVVRDAHNTFSWEPPDIRPLNIALMRRILYCLLDLNHPELLPLFREFKDTDLPIGEGYFLEVFNSQELVEKFGESCRDFPAVWLENQAAWRPWEFQLGFQSHFTIPAQRVVPFYVKRELKPHPEGQEPRSNRAKLYEVHVPNELIKCEPPSMLNESQILIYNDPPNFPVRTYRRFALKEFMDKQSWDKEGQTFRALDAQSGMIACYGCYKSIGNQTFGIFLEFADSDLNEAVLDEEPPVTPGEIWLYYKSMHELSTTLSNIHRLNIIGQEYDFWHGDIKPENILRVGDHFKLADPGDSWIQRASNDGKQKAKAEVYGGTRSFASPEKACWLDSTDDRPADKILQNSDVWSLGCVFSIAATYVVLGEQGVKLYNRVRRYAHKKLDLGLVQDVFHANGVVLDSVKQWHVFLRMVVRQGDELTASVLDMIDHHMLVTPEDHRWESTEVAKHFGSLLERARTDIEYKDVPQHIREILLEEDLRAEIDQESEGGINRLDSDIAKKHFREVQENEARTITRSRFKSQADLLSAKIKPTAQRSVYRANLLKKINDSQDQLSTTLLQQNSLERYSLRTDSNTPPTLGIVGKSPSTDFISIFQMRDKLETLKRGRNLKNLFNALTRGRTSVRRELGEDILEPYYPNRDIVFLVDNGWTMEKHWAEVMFVFETLVWRLLGYDDDGIELYFTNSGTHASVKRNAKQDVEMFVDAMREARPTPHSPRTELRPALAKIEAGFDEAGRKPRTVFILTDGEWHMPYERDIEMWVKTLLCVLAGQDPETLQSPIQKSRDSWQSKFEDTRPITFQFIAFGHSLDGKARMKRLDDRLKQYGLPDLIDMEPSTGDARKMLLGSLTSEWDGQVNAVNHTRDLSPSSSMSNGTSPTTSVSHGLGVASPTPRTSSVSTQLSQADSSHSRRASSVSVATLHPYETHESSRHGRSLTPQREDRRGTSIGRSPSGRSQTRRSGFFGALGR